MEGNTMSVKTVVFCCESGCPGAVAVAVAVAFLKKCDGGGIGWGGKSVSWISSVIYFSRVDKRLSMARTMIMGGIDGRNTLLHSW